MSQQIQALLPALNSNQTFAETIPRWAANNGLQLNSGQMRTTAIYLTAGQVVSKINFFVGTVGGATLTGEWGGLFTLSGSTLTLVAATANQGLATLAQNSPFSWPIATIASGSSSTYTVPSTGLYYVGITTITTSGTIPNIPSALSLITVNTGTATPAPGMTITGLTTTVSAIGSTISGSGSAYTPYYALS
jgi:hypothetical protein